jgi:ATP adenylyltransferase
MKYLTYLKTHKKCPFCDYDKSRILIENKEAFLTYSKAPYHKYHLMVVPKKHVETINDLNRKENTNVMALISKGMETLKKVGLNDCTIVMRDGQALGRSVKHIHYNIIPSGKIDDVSIITMERKILNKKEEESLRKELKRIINL